MINREQRLARQRLVNLEEITVIEDKSCQVEDTGDGVGGADTHDAVMRIQGKIVARETILLTLAPSKGGVYYCVWLLYCEQKELVQRRQDEHLEQTAEVHLNQRNLTVPDGHEHIRVNYRSTKVRCGLTCINNCE